MPAAFTEKQFCPRAVDRNMTQQSPLEEALVNLEPGLLIVTYCLRGCGAKSLTILYTK